MSKHKHHKRDLMRFFLQYGVQVLVILFIVNFVVFYAVNFLSRAQAPGTDLALEPSSSPMVSDSPHEPSENGSPTPTSEPVGPVVGLIIKMPGIGSGSAVIQPLHKNRPVSILLYNEDEYSYNKKVKPLYTIRTQVVYDDDANSPTYTNFVNPYIDLGVLDDASYQIALKANQTMPQLIRSTNPAREGGQLFSFVKGAGATNNIIPPQTMLSGDIFPYPDGDSVMDINDYNALVNCFGNKSNTSECKNKLAADLDDNGVIDGTDYNLLVLGFEVIKELGLPVPSIILTPTPKPTRLPKTTLAPSLTATPSSKVKSSNGGGLVLFLILFLFLGGGVFVLLKTKRGHTLLARFNKNQKSTASAEQTAGMESQIIEEQPATSETDVQPTEQQTATQESSISNDVPPSPETQTETPTIATNTENSAVESTFLVKIKTTDDTGTWVLLTDDNGLVNGFFPGKNIKDGFAKVKGVMKNDAEGKNYVEISELTTSD